MQNAFRKISRVGGLAGGTKWYLSEDCLLAAKRVMYVVEYRRFYLRDLESIVVWPSRFWVVRPILQGVIFGALGNFLWWSVGLKTGAFFWAIGLAWVVLELALGPTAQAQIRTTGLTVDLPIVRRARRARKVLAMIDAAVRAARGDEVEQVTLPAAATQPSRPPLQTTPDTSPPPAPVVDLT